jgi:hypothetical protein
VKEELLKLIEIDKNNYLLFEVKYFDYSGENHVFSSELFSMKEDDGQLYSSCSSGI